MSLVWTEACRIPEALEVTLRRGQGIDRVLSVLAEPDARRIIVTGNGAAYYAGMALWLTSLSSRGPDVVALPAGLVSGRDFCWRDGDVLLAISSSGEFRDVVQAAQSAPRALAVTANPDSSLARSVEAAAIACLVSSGGATHTQAFCANVFVLLSLWSELTRDAELRRALGDVPGVIAACLETAPAWAAEQAASLPDLRAAIVFGTGPAGAAALEAALLLKEVAGVPAEGLETREGATSGMYGLGPGQLALSVDCGPDLLVDEAEHICAAMGAATLRLPGAEHSDSRLAALHSFPAALALAIALAEKAGRDVDAPGWVGVYEMTSRKNPSPSGGSI
jgi:D-arabinose 5-phosphate isomerase GutQ